MVVKARSPRDIQRKKQLSGISPLTMPTYSWRPRTLREAVMLTLAFFDAQDIALTAFEVWQNLIGWQATYLEVDMILRNDPAIKKHLACHDGFYRLGPRSRITQRFNNLKTCERYYKVARRVAGWLVFVPFITSVSVVNNVAAGNARGSSDIDFFVTACPGFLWLTRFLTTGVVQLLARRKHGARHAGRICLSFFAVDTSLAMEKFAIDGGDDFYLANWLFNVAPLYNRTRAFSKRTGPGPGPVLRERRSKNFDVLAALEEANGWARRIFPQAQMRSLSQRRQVARSWQVVGEYVKRPVEFLLLQGPGRYLEKKIRGWQLKRMGKSVPYERKTRTAHVVITDQVLKFHEEDRRVWFKEKTLRTYAELKKGRFLAVPLIRSMPGLNRAGVFVQPVGETVSA